ncbi:hypothetical protein D9758_015002 [Tetrapyrgos nigripes]|uniref:Major facilitator superfamily (MFS) profile domain-containing protein n=1 Tax=Tetrapyrgos nigripes TaxID=182062 RepID=A0A8H5FKA3_9AGAR|nr:hypothetical protein D9758_015002 [Tetrapyrgos nigripes]
MIPSSLLLVQTLLCIKMSKCFSTRNLSWKRTVNGMMLQFIQQLNDTILGAVSVYLIETWGRRRSLLTGSTMEAVCAIITGLIGHFTLAPPGTDPSQLTPSQKRGGDVLIAFAVLHMFSFAVFWGPVPWVPLRVRPKAIALGSATNWICIGSLILMIFFGMLVFGFVYVYLFIPETKGLILEEVDEMYVAGIKLWNSASWKPHRMEEAHEKVANARARATGHAEVREVEEKV